MTKKKPKKYLIVRPLSKKLLKEYIWDCCPSDIELLGLRDPKECPLKKNGDKDCTACWEKKLKKFEYEV